MLVLHLVFVGTSEVFLFWEHQRSAGHDVSMTLRGVCPRISADASPGASASLLEELKCAGCFMVPELQVLVQFFRNWGLTMQAL